MNLSSNSKEIEEYLAQKINKRNQKITWLESDLRLILQVLDRGTVIVENAMNKLKTEIQPFQNYKQDRLGEQSAPAKDQFNQEDSKDHELENPKQEDNISKL